MSFEGSFERDLRNPKQLDLGDSELSAVNLEKSSKSKSRRKSKNNLRLNLDNSSSFESPLKHMNSLGKKSQKASLGIPGMTEEDGNEHLFEVDASNINGHDIEEEEIEDDENYSDEENDDVRSLFPSNHEELNKFKPIEKGKINPLLVNSVLALKNKLNSSINASINASRRSFMKKKAAQDIGEKDADQKKIKTKLEKLQKLRFDSQKQQDRIMDNGDENLQKDSKELEEKKRAFYNNKRLKNLLQMGELGLDLEELSVGIERKYEEMLNILRRNVKTIKIYFLERLEEVQRDFNEKIMNEKQQNLSNIKELEEQLRECFQAVKKKREEEDGEIQINMDENSRSLYAFREMFTFMKDFREESYSLILSKPVDLDLNFLKSELNKNFIDKYLNGLTTPPKAFPTELYRFFLNNQESNPFEEDITYGEAISVNGQFPSSIGLKRQDLRFETGLDSKSRAPLIKVLDNKYLVTATRDKFALYAYSHSKKSNGLVRRKSKFASGSLDGGVDQNKKVLKKHMLISSEDVEFGVSNPGFHCMCYLQQKDGTRCLLFGGNHNKIYKFQLKSQDNDVIEEVVYLGVLDLKEKHPQLPRQKVNGLFQYKNTKHLVAILSYGYTITFTMETSKEDKISSVKRIHKGNISSATFLNDYQYFITCSGSFSRNHDNTILISKCCLAQDLFLRQIHSFSNAHGKFKGVMNVKSTNCIEDNILISCGNQDDSRICIWDIEARELVHEIKVGENDILEELSDDLSSGIGVGGRRGGVMSKATAVNSVSNKKFSFYNMGVVVLDEDRDEDDLEEEEGSAELWKVSGVVIIAASISSVHLYAYDYRTKETKKKQVLRIGADIGSYLSIMQMIKEPILMDEASEDDVDRITIIVGTTKGYFEQLTLSLEFEYSDHGSANNLLPDIGFGGGFGGGMQMEEVKEDSEDMSVEERNYTGSNSNYKNKRFMY